MLYEMEIKKGLNVDEDFLILGSSIFGFYGKQLHGKG